MTKFLHFLSSARVKERSISYCEGIDGDGYMRAVAVVLCPDDTTATIENQIIYHGPGTDFTSFCEPTKVTIEPIFFRGGTGKKNLVVTSGRPSEKAS